MISFLGDVFLNKPYKVDIELGDYIFNLEYPLSCEGTPAKNKVNLCQDTSFIAETFGKFPLAVCLANNHIMDYGEEAFTKTVDYLEKNNIQYFGAGKESDNFNNPAILNVRRSTMALFGYSCPSTHAEFGDKLKNGSAFLDEEKIIKDIKAIRDQADFIVIQIHWGEEEIKYPKYEDTLTAKILIDAGADLIIGHHAHVIQSYEIYKNKYIYYGLGNFIFPDLKVPSYYDGIEFKENFIKKQNKNNRIGLIVSLSDNRNISHKIIKIVNNYVQETTLSLPTWIPSSKKSFKRYYSLWLKKKKILNFIASPKIPTLTQLIRFVNQ